MPGIAASSKAVSDEQSFHEEIRELLQHANPKKEINVGSLKEAYINEFQKPLPQGEDESVGAVLKRAENAGVCRLEMRRGGLWLLDVSERADGTEGHQLSQRE